MPAPTPLQISTSSLVRLLKEEQSYRTELESQERRLKASKEAQGGEEEKGTEGNRVWMVRQETQALEETKAVFGPLREKIADAVSKVEGILESDAHVGTQEERERAREAVGKAGRVG